jgi:hypothetical protein
MYCSKIIITLFKRMNTYVLPILANSTYPLIHSYTPLNLPGLSLSPFAISDKFFMAGDNLD